MDQIKHPVWVIDPKDSFRYCYVNAATCSHHGYSEEELLCNAIPDWDPYFQSKECVEFWEKLREEGKLTFESVHRLKNQKLVNVEISSSYLNYDGREYIAGVFQNIDNRKQAEDKLLQAINYRDQIVGVLGHDLRSPLSSIKGFVELLREEKEFSKDSQDYIFRINRAADRMLEMIETLLDFSKSRFGGSFPLDCQRLSFSKICTSIIQELKGAWPNREIQYTSEGDCIGDFDGWRINQMITNLINNAIVHGCKIKPVVVHLSCTINEVKLIVKNHGQPIPQDFITEIFKPFRQLDARDPASRRGLGLGLYIVDQIARGHGGSGKVWAAFDLGAIFSIKIPRKKENFSFYFFILARQILGIKN